MKKLYKDIKKSILGHFNFVPVGHEYHRLEVLIGLIYATIVGMNCSYYKAPIPLITNMVIEPAEI